MSLARKSRTPGNGQSTPVVVLSVGGFLTTSQYNIKSWWKKQRAGLLAYICSTWISACLSWDRTKSRYRNKLLELNSFCQPKSLRVWLIIHFAHIKQVYNALQFAIVFPDLVHYFAQGKRANPGKSKQISFFEWTEWHLVKNQWCDCNLVKMLFFQISSGLLV